MKTQSRKRRGEARLRQAVLEAVVLRDGEGCFASVVIRRRYHDGCGWPLTCAGELDGHEVIPRSRWPGGHLVASNIRRLCRKHHSWVHENPEVATKLGLLASSWDRP